MDWDEYAAVAGGLLIFIFALFMFEDEMQAILFAASFILFLIISNVLSIERGESK